MLTGEYRHSVDSKKRLFIPAKHREELGPSFVIARDLRGPRLKVFTEQKWETDYLEPIRKLLDRKTAEEVMRFLHKDAISVHEDLDAQGRVILNQGLLTYAGIDLKDAPEVVVVGCADYCEIWSAKLYDAEMAKEDPEAIRAALEKLGL
jgi:MraZ protein